MHFTKDGVFAVLVCRVVMGKMNKTKSDTKAAEKVTAGEFDSTCGTRALAAGSWLIAYLILQLTKSHTFLVLKF